MLEEAEGGVSDSQQFREKGLGARQRNRDIYDNYSPLQGESSLK